jgi:glucosyl-dolichyl phosphate glucuronosyltransferase
MSTCLPLGKAWGDGLAEGLGEIGVIDPMHIPEGRKPLISVVICTRNRAELLSRALTSVVEQAFPRPDYEILVVDNKSTDRTHEIVKQFQGKATVRYLHEGHVGLCIARNTGWRNAAGRYVAFFDDDAIASPAWLAAIRDGFTSASPCVGAIGGPARPIWEKSRPTWLSDAIVCSLTVIDWGPSEKLIDDISREWLVGANMAIPKALLAEVGGFHPSLDRVGNNLLSGGDVFLQKEIMRRGYRCLYSPAMAIGHLIPVSRMHQNWFIRRYYWQGVSDAVIHLIEKNPSFVERVGLAFTRAMRVLGSRHGIASLLSRPNQPKAFAEKCFALIDLGFAAGLLGAARR